jgi:predicted permease
MSGPLLIVLPVFGFIALGYVSVAVRLIPAPAADGIAAFVFTLALPLLLFRALGTLALPEVSPWAFWAAYFAGVFLSLALGILVTRRVFGRDARAGLIGGVSAAYSNVVMVGVPVVQQAYGEPGLVMMLVLVAIHLPIMMAVSITLVEIIRVREAGGHFRFGATVRNIAREMIRNPLIVGILAGAAYRVTGLPLTGVPRTVIDGVSNTSVPLALICLGMTLHRYGIRGQVVPAVALGVLKLVLMPAVVYVVAVHVLGIPDLAAAVAVLGASCPTGANAFLIATRFDTGLALSASTITLTTLASIATLTIALALFHA